MTAVELVAALEARGLRVSERDGSLAIAPRSRVTQSDREALLAHKAALLAHLRQRTVQVARVSLWTLDRILEVAVPWSDVRLLIAPGCRVARELRASDSRPGRVWCVCEVIDLVLTGVKPDDVRKIAETKITFDATPAGITKAGDR